MATQLGTTCVQNLSCHIMSVPPASCGEKNDMVCSSQLFPEEREGKYIFEPRHRWHLLTSGAVQVSALESDSQ